MTDAIAHRGPDGGGASFDLSVADDQIALGHRRLAIIDPVGGAQPMHSTDGRLTIVFNGEIYNFRQLREELASEHGSTFRTDCDTEVLLEAYRIYGVECLPRLRGMFSFAIWDRWEQRLCLARDPHGKKPLFLLRLDDGFAFASEIKSLLACEAALGRGPRLNLSVLPSYLLYRYVPGPETFFAGIEKLPPGCYATWQARGELTLHVYYQLPKAAPAHGRRLEQTISDYARELDRSVSDRLVSDAPFGAFLSGGIDSASIVALMSRHLSHPVRTFSIGFEDDRGSELPAASRVAQYFKTEHTELIVSARDIFEGLEDSIKACDAPISEPASIALLLLSREAGRSVKMVLSGEGADESMGGYGKHSLERFAGLYSLAPSIIRFCMKGVLGALPGATATKLATSLEILSVEDRGLRHALWFGSLRAHELHLLRGAMPKSCGDQREDEDDLNSLLRFDQSSWLPDNLLERGDRMTMSASIEARMPFMDQDLMALSWTIPSALKVRGFTGKWLLRQAMKGVLPDHVLNQRKRGFPMPVAEWARGALKQDMTDILLDKNSIAADLVGREHLAHILTSHSHGADRSKALWQLYNLNKFCSIYGLNA